LNSVAATLLSAVRRYGVVEAARLAYHHLNPLAKLRAQGVLAAIEGRIGLEIGGPSAAFAPGGLVPAYAAAARIDNCNFARETVWERGIEEGPTFRFEPRRAPGFQHIAEATELRFAPDGVYDFVLSSHTIEHTANPLAALVECRRVLKPGGLLVLVAPHRDGTFDHRRPVTTMAHLIADFERGSAEDDPTHLAEVLALHDLTRDPDAGTREAFTARTLAFADNRSLHHHVFDTRLALALVAYAGFAIASAEAREPCHIIVIARAPQAGARADARPFDRPAPAILGKSPFASDHFAAAPQAP